MKKYLAIAFAACGVAGAELVTLKNLSGRSITAKIDKVESSTVWLTRDDGKPFSVSLADLDEASQKAVMAAAEKPQSGPTRVRLIAKTGAMTHSLEKQWETSWGSYDKNVFRVRSVDASVECTLGGGPAALVVQWVGSTAGKASDQQVVRVEAKPITLKAGGTNSGSFAVLFVESDANYEALGERVRDGIRYTGWIVRVIGEDGEVLGVQTSRQTLPGIYPPPDAAAVKVLLTETKPAVE